MTLFTLAVIHLFAVASPGPDFTAVMRETISFSLRNGLVASLGIAVGNFVLILFSVFGANYLISQHPEYLRWIQVLGAAYLFYLGVQSVKSFARGLSQKGSVSNEAPMVTNASLGKSFVNGFVTTMGNPKAIMYFVSLSAQVMSIEQSAADLSILIGMLVLITGVWFTFLAMMVGNSKVRPQLVKNKIYLELLMGLVLILYGTYFLLKM